MENNENYTTGKPQNNNRRATLGFILLALGAFSLLSQFVFFTLPYWVFSWPTLLIIIGFALGVKNNFNKPGAIILIAIGGIGLANMAFGFHYALFWPVVMIAIGLHFIFNRGRHHNIYWRGPGTCNNADYRSKL